MHLKAAIMLVAALANAVLGKNKLIIVGMSGLRHDFVDRPSLDAFQRFINTGFKATKVKIPMITNSWPSLWTLATGLWPEEHGVIDDIMYDPTINLPFYGGVTKTDTRWFPYKPIWISAEEDGVKAAVSGWPGSDVKHGTVQATFVHPFISKETEEETKRRIDDFCGWMYDQADIGLFLLPEPDNAAHENSLDSDELQNALLQNNRLINHLIETLNLNGVDSSSTNIILVGDHGMMEHESSHVTYLSDFGVSLGDFKWYTSNLFTTGMILPHDGLAESIYEKLSQRNASEYFTAYTAENLPERFHIKNHRRITPIVLVANTGYRIQITRPHTDDSAPVRVVGMHGYDSNEVEMMTAMLASGPDFKRGKLEEIRSIDIYPLLCSLLKLNTCHGTDATIDVPQQMVNGVLMDKRPPKLNYATLNMDSGDSGMSYATVSSALATYSSICILLISFIVLFTVC
ncbi:ectonucleotide pyrophosphatase/phosphodiesterase family member 5-like [Watersipora subatra]|uniref:ectonucleotide pyrophosphatase/phosphodiesterase family member 5-like n=1 Tax=Watersipora subatra TaxID=2589382 RepID=UPI00355C309E